MVAAKGASLAMTPDDPIQGTGASEVAEGTWPRNARNIAARAEHLAENGIYALDPRDPRARPFNLMRAQVLNGLSQVKGRVLAITSASALNGKSHVAANLACAISRVRETTLVDLHLRRPVIGERFGLPAIDGVSAYLDGSNELGQLGFGITGERLSIHAAGNATEDSSMLLTSQRIDELFAQFHRDPAEPICIVDTPPVLESDDMLLIAKQVDAVLFVVEEGKTTRNETLESFRLLNGTTVLGTVMNKAMDPLAALHR